MIWESIISEYAGKTVEVTLRSGATMAGELRTVPGDEYCVVVSDGTEAYDVSAGIRGETTTYIWVEQIAAISHTKRTRVRSFKPAESHTL